MPWLRVEPHFPRHGKVEQLTSRVGKDMALKALGLWLVASCWAVENLSDGFVPDWLMKTKRERALADELVEAKLWERTKGGFQIHDFLKYNFPKEWAEKQRAIRMAGGRARAEGADRIGGRFAPAGYQQDTSNEPARTISQDITSSTDPPATPEDVQTAKEQVAAFVAGFARSHGVA